MASRRDVSEPVLFDILLLLPVISLLRFKTISKSWCSLIESSTFITQHLYHNGEKNNLIFVSHENEFYMLSGRKYDVCSNLDFKGIYPKNIFKIVNSCNGILCLAHRMSGDYWHLSLWNPATKQVRQLPEPSYLRKSGRVCHAFGLGFDKITNDYKIVMMSLYRGMFSLNDTLVQMYSMRTDSWRTIHEGDDFPIAWIDLFVAVACNGEICLWIGRSFSNIVIFYFDFANEVYGTVPLPDGHRNAQTYSLGFLNDKIACIKCRGCYKTSCSYYEIWMMNELGKKESWNKVYKLEEPILPYRRVGLKNFSKNGEFILTTKEGGTDDGLYLYNVVTQEETLLLGVHQVRSIINYNESLVSVKSAN